jgi:hypothetical protein
MADQLFGFRHAASCSAGRLIGLVAWYLSLAMLVRLVVGRPSG